MSSLLQLCALISLMIVACVFYQVNPTTSDPQMGFVEPELVSTKPDLRQLVAKDINKLRQHKDSVLFQKLQEFLNEQVWAHFQTLLNLTVALPPPISIDKKPVIFILGDSVSRYIVFDTCAHFNSPVKPLLPADLMYQSSPEKGAAVCVTPFGTIGFVHLFGSRLDGPYKAKWTSGENELMFNTSIRLPKAISAFREQYGDPHLLVYGITWWDILVPEAVLPPEFAINTAHNLAWLRQLCHADTIYLTPTYFHKRWGSKGVPFFQNLRKTAASHHLYLADWEEYNALLPIKYLRDSIHPGPEIGVVIAKALFAFASIFVSH